MPWKIAGLMLDRLGEAPERDSRGGCPTRVYLDAFGLCGWVTSDGAIYHWFFVLAGTGIMPGSKSEKGVIPSF
jgi:hypothetical protein